MPVNLYRRHRQDCEAGHPADFRSGEFEERKKAWKRCACHIFASGTIHHTFKRKDTGRSDWAQARAVASAWEASGWEGEVPPSPVPELPVTPKITIERAVNSFLAAHSKSSALGTQRMNRYFMNRFRSFSEDRGYVLLDQWGPIDVREFRASWCVAASTTTRNMTMLKSFFEFALGNEWIARKPAKLVKDARGRRDTHKEERIPFSDDELKRMFEACETRYASPDDKGSWRYRWGGQDLADFISISVYTGLRISDVCTFHIDRLLQKGECHIRTTKNGKKVYTWIPSWLQQRIRERAETHGAFIFGTHTTTDMSVVTDVCRRKLLRLWSMCGPWPNRPSPHRFRHTFARILLQKANVTVRDVAELLGNTEEIVRKHYAAWVPERQARLTRVLQEAFQDKPMPKLVVIGRR